MVCLECGRVLKNQKSKKLGYGPICYKRKYGITPHTSRSDAQVSAEEVAHNLPGQISMEDYLQTLLAQ